jgi:SAM-dependent methyltransferase
MAPVYDAFTAHYDCELWLGNLLPELEGLGLRKGRLLDVGCGTGNSFLPMLQRGWRVLGCDISAAMLERARKKVSSSVELEYADMRALPRFGEFDLVWALDDAVNYLLSIEELGLALSGMRRNLAQHGLLMFDVNTLGTYRGFFAETHVVERDGQRLIWRGQTSPKVPAGSVCEARFDIEGPIAEAHLHRQRHFDELSIKRALRDAGLECRAIFGHGEDAVLEQPLDECRHTKAVYMASPAS